MSGPKLPIDEIIPEPGEGAHTDPDAAAQFLRAAIARALDELGGMSADQLVSHRYNKFRNMGNFFSEG